jgi:hypothetical protein
MGQSAHDSCLDEDGTNSMLLVANPFGFDGEISCGSAAKSVSLDLKRGSRRKRFDMNRLLRAIGSFLSRYLNRQTLGAYPHPAADLALMSQLLSRTDRLATAYDTPDAIRPDVVMETANVFLQACGHAQGVLPRLRTGVASYDAQDEALLQKIKAAVAAESAALAAQRA